MAHKHSVRDSGAHFFIDQFTRQIKNDSANKTTIVQYDHNSERLTFEIPLDVDGHAMTLCDLIEIHYINISTDGNSQNPGTYEVTDIKAEGENAVFTWLISQECTQLAGSLNFFIVFKCTENGVTVYRWGTEIFKNLPISAGMDNGEAVLTEYPDILAQWKAQLFSASDTAVLNVATAEANALAAIEAAGEAKKQSVLDSIPDEYEALSALADQNHRNKAGAIVLDAEGESIVVNDASEYPLQNLKVFGKSTQDGTPTPDSPVDIISVGNPIVTVCKKNYCSSQDYAVIFPCRLEKGVTYTVSLDNEVSDAMCLLVYDKNQIRLQSVKCTNDNGKRRYATLAPTEDVYYAQWAWANATTVENGQIEIGSEATAYEPYNGQTVETSHTLPGIPVSSGGNYTDANGQQWICDEVDLARGMYMQRLAHYVFDGSADERWEFLDGYMGAYVIQGERGSSQYATPMYCNYATRISWGTGSQDKHYCFINGYDDFVIGGAEIMALYPDLSAFKAQLSIVPCEVIYQRETPIETPLSDAEISAFKALHSNRPNTTILNDAGAHMAVSYVADTKTYIDNAIAKITNA